MSDKQCPLRNMPKVSSQMVRVDIEPGLSAWRAEFIPTTPYDRDISHVSTFCPVCVSEPKLKLLPKN